MKPPSNDADADATRQGPSPDEPTRKTGKTAKVPVVGLADGAVLQDGRYQILRELGSGGTSTVYLAFDHELERRVAIKVLRDGAEAAVLLDEARMQASVTVPSVVAVHELHLDARPPFLVLEHVDGVSLDRCLRQESLSWKDKWRVLRTVAGALDDLHDHGIAHGDVKAANVLVGRDGRTKLADFGVTRLLRRARAGELVGTPAYMPPERAAAMPVPDALQTAGDVYSFAVLVYVTLTGRPPFVEASLEALLSAHVTERPPEISTLGSLPASLDAPLARALAKDPRTRTPRAGALMAELEQAIRGLDAAGRPLRVLVVDDDESHRQLHVAVLRSSLPAATIESAESGHGALAHAAVHAPDVLVVDLAMPEVSGLALTEQARAFVPATSVVMVTGQGSGRERTAAMALGVRHFLVKPVEAGDLTRCVLDCAEAPRG